MDSKKLKPAGKAIGYPTKLGVLRTIIPGSMSPTRDLGRVLVELAIPRWREAAERRKGEWAGSNIGIRRLADLEPLSVWQGFSECMKRGCSYAQITRREGRSTSTYKLSMKID